MAMVPRTGGKLALTKKLLMEKENEEKSRRGQIRRRSEHSEEEEGATSLEESASSSSEAEAEEEEESSEEYEEPNSRKSRRARGRLDGPAGGVRRGVEGGKAIKIEEKESRARSATFQWHSEPVFVPAPWLIELRRKWQPDPLHGVLNHNTKLLRLERRTIMKMKRAARVEWLKLHRTHYQYRRDSAAVRTRAGGRFQTDTPQFVPAPVLLERRRAGLPLVTVKQEE